MKNNPQKTSGLSGLLRSVFDVGGTVIISVAAVIVIRTFVVQPFLVSGSSMEPNLHDGNYLLIDEISYRLREPKRGEVIVFKYPSNPKVFYVKRIIGLPGETVSFKDGGINVEKNNDNIVLGENYVAAETLSDNFRVTLKNDEYFVMGDNRNFSFDSRRWGPLKKTAIIGLVRLRLWPINEAMAFERPDY